MTNFLQSAANISNSPETREPIRNDKDEVGEEWGWHVRPSQAVATAEFLADEAMNAPDNFKVLDVSSHQTVLEQSSVDGGFSFELGHLLRSLIGEQVLTINFAEPPVSVHIATPDAVAAIDGTYYNGDDTLYALSIDFTAGNPPAWLGQSGTPEA